MIGLIVLALLCGGVSAGSHSLRYFLTAITPIHGLPQFVLVSFVDEVQFFTYDSDRKELIPREQWMVESEGPESWERKFQLVQMWEKYQKAQIQMLMSRSNQSGGIHTFQQKFGCELRDDGTTSGFAQLAWDGRDLISFDKDHMVWVTQVPWAQSIKNSWDQNTARKLQCKNHLEQVCIEWLKIFLQYGNQLLRPVPPIVSFIRPGEANRLSCVVTGFYPQAIEVTLWRDGMLVDETQSSGILPNHDSTYQIQKWVEFDPKDQAEYSCQVEHSGLEEMVMVIYVPKSESMVPAIVGVIGVLGLLIALSIVAVVIYRKKVGGKSGYNPTTTSNQGESSCSSSANA